MVQLVKRAMRSDTDAFLELIECNSLAMYKVARAILGNDEDAADAIQDTILICFEKIHTLKNPEYFKTWLIRILINECNQILRHYRNMNLQEDFPEIPRKDMSMAEFEFKEMLSQVEEKYRIILVLYYVEVYKISEIAELLDMNENTVKTRLSRAREQIRAVYANTPRQGNTGRQSMTIIQRKGEVSDEKREKTLSREFSVPESVDKAKEQAFAKIRVASGQKMPQEEARRHKPDRRRMRFMTKVMGGAVAAAAVFTVICVSNPALAENIPLIGHVFEELGENLGFSGDYSKYAKPLGEEKTAENEAIAAAGGPVYDDYYKLIEIPDSFTFTMNVHQIIGDKAENETPQMPQELKDAYDAAMAEHGLNEADYENFTDEEKEIEHQLFNEMYQKFYEKYPEANGLFNEYSNWFMDGDWEFSVDVTKDTSETIVKEINDIDENGLGIVSVTKTPFEITFEDAMGTADGFTVVLDAEGQLMEYGSGGSTNTVAIKDRDVSKIDLYICDYVEYMDEIKGYNFGWDIAESGYNTFKELLEAKALHHTEVVFG